MLNVSSVCHTFCSKKLFTQLICWNIVTPYDSSQSCSRVSKRNIFYSVHTHWERGNEQTFWSTGLRTHRPNGSRKIVLSSNMFYHKKFQYLFWVKSSYRGIPWYVRFHLNLMVLQYYCLKVSKKATKIHSHTKIGIVSAIKQKISTKVE